MCFFGCLSVKPLQRGPKKRWKYIIRKDLNCLNIQESFQHDLAIIQDLPGETITCLESSQVLSVNVDLHTVACPECHRGFRSISDFQRHKCIAEREKPYT